MKLLLKTLTIFAAVSACLSACVHDPVEPEVREVSFKNEIQPFLNGTCNALTCHGDTSQGAGQPLFNSYYNFVENADIEAGEPENSKGYKRILNGEMPPTGIAVPDENVQLLKYWILQGAKNN
jgi:hypothetical protein